MGSADGGAAAARTAQVEGMTLAAFQDLLDSSPTDGVLVDFCTEWSVVDGVGAQWWRSQSASLHAPVALLP